MKTVIKLFYATLILMIFTGCSTESLDEFEESSLDKSLTSARGAASNDGILVPIEYYNGYGDGTASLVRNKNGISLQVHSNGLTPGNAYTAWFIVFDGEPFDNDGLIVVHAAGHIVGGNGNATFAGHLSTGEIGEPNGTDILANIGDGSFGNPLGSHVLIDIVDHGPAVAGTIPENIHEITGAIGLAQEWHFDPGN